MTILYSKEKVNLETLEYISEGEYIVGGWRGKAGGERRKGRGGEGEQGMDGEGTAICEYVRRYGSHFQNCLRAHDCPF